MFCDKLYVAHHSIEFHFDLECYPTPVWTISIVAHMFCSKSPIAYYNVEFRQLWGLPNPRVEDLPSFLKCFAISRL